MNEQTTNITNAEAEKIIRQIDDQKTKIEAEAERIQRVEELKKEAEAKEEEVYEEGELIKLIPYPSFSEGKSVGTMLPKNMANETVTNLSLLAKEFDFIDFVKEKLGYSSRIKVIQSFASEQIDALVLAIKSFEKNNAFILGDMAGIGKGRVCAGVMRYTYMQGLIPVFLSQKPYLFNDIYRDILAIGGLGSYKGKYVEAKPFIMHNQGVIVNRKTGNIVPTAQSYKETYKDGVTVYRFVDRGNPNSIIELCRSMEETIQETGRIELFKEFNCVMLPYSVISQGKSGFRRKFLSAIAPKSILVFDESHAAASANEDSKILRTGLPLVNDSKGVLFSSATYAKNPTVFNLYVVKTALRTAVPSLDSITDALKVGGENVSEYIASGLVKEGQMIRRERSFGDCKKYTEYVGKNLIDSNGEISYTDIQDDKQREIFNEAIGYFKELRDFSKSQMTDEAIRNAINREIENSNIEVVSYKEYEKIKRIKKAASSERANFISENRNKYVLSYSRDSISRYKATFRENLFLALKAKFSADKIIECLNKRVEYTNYDGTKHYAPQKPLIAMANTGEAIFSELRLELNQEIKNDFSVYLKAIYNKLFVGEFTLRKIDRNIFESIKDLEKEDIEYELLEYNYEVNLSDFSDGGEEVQRINSKLDAYNSSLPFSIIDYLRDRIESESRSNIYFDKDGNALYGKAESAKYRFSEATSRKYMIKRDEFGVLRYQKNDRITSTTKIFRDFNDGAIDVMLINVVASTGGSAQSSPDEGIDTRPRNMFIVQFELDINIEVQKRGRINRTGQINSPTYTYIITQIPVELRKYLMFRKKLRKLDANVSADQSASSKQSEITDIEGNPIEDIFNHYGYEIFKDDFIYLPDNNDYLTIFENLHWRSKEVKEDGTAEKEEINVEHFQSFVLELELYPASFQEVFFNEMNRKYIQKKADLIAKNEYQAELQAQNYKASLRQRIVIQLNSGSTVFSLPLFLTDYYCLESKKPLSKDKVEKKASELAIWQGEKVTPQEFYARLKEDFLRESIIAQKNYEDELKIVLPKEEDYPSTEDGKEEFRKDFSIAEANKEIKLRAYRDGLAEIKDAINYFYPMRKIMYNGNLGMFVGYKIHKTETRYKYTKGNIGFVFCCLSQFPLITLKLTTQVTDIQSIIIATNSYLRAGNDSISSDLVRKIDEWKPNLNRREIKRFMNGNILSGIVEANKRKREGKFNSWALTRFSNIDGSITTAIELKYQDGIKNNEFLRPIAEKLSVAADNFNIIDYIKQMPISTGIEFGGAEQNIFPLWNIEGDKICDRAICIIRKETGIEFQIMQSYYTREDKETKVKEEIQRKENEVLYNFLYYDKQFEEDFQSYLVAPEPQKTSIKYALLRVVKDKDFSTKYNTFKVYIKKYCFLESDTESMQAFLNELYRKYEVNFNFRSDIAEYYNVDVQSDVPIEKVKAQQVKAFPEGIYEYRFINEVKKSVVESIPYLIETTSNGSKGGVLLSQPLMPNMLPSFEMKPYKFPAEILVKLTFSVLNDDDKSKFAKELEEMAEVKNDDAATIGNYVRLFLSDRSVGITYFFGDLRMSEYGSIFREYALKQDLKDLVFEEEEIKVERNIKTQINMDDAEKFIIKLWNLT